jgi:uncharacterized protein (TIGR03437 family)
VAFPGPSTFYSQTLTATGGTGPYTWQILSSPTPPSWLSITTGGMISGTPPSQGAFSATVEAIDQTGLPGSQLITLEVNISGKVITTNLPAGMAIINVSGTQDASNHAATGAANLLWDQPFSVPGQLLEYTVPPGTYTMRVIDPADAAAIFPTLTISQQTSMWTAWTYNVPWVTAYLAFDISATSNASQTQLFSGADDFNFPGTGDPASAYADAVNGYTVNSTNFPPFYNNIYPLIRNATPQTTVTFPLVGTGPETLIFAVPDNGYQDNAGGISVLIAPAAAALNITTTSLANGQVGLAYTPTNLAASGGSGIYVWTATGLPSGLSVSTGGVLNGTPTFKGPFTVFFTVTDPVSGLFFTQQTPFNVTIAAPSPALTINTTSIPQGETGVTYTQAISATGGYGTYNWTISSGSPPLTINSSGVLQSPGPLTTGNEYMFTVTVTDTAGDSVTSPVYTLLVDGAVVITTSSLPNAAVGESWAATLAAGGGTTTYSWSVPANSLPAGLSLSSSGVISGVPTTSSAQPTSFNVTVTDSAGGTNTVQLSIQVGMPIGYLVENSTLGGLVFAPGDGSAVSLQAGVNGYDVAQDAGVNAVVATGTGLERITPFGGNLSSIAAAPSGSSWVAVATDPFGNFIVGDNLAHEIWRVSPDGASTVVVTTYPVTNANQQEDIKILVDVHGNYIVAEDNAGAVGLLTITPGGSLNPVSLTGSTLPASVGGLTLDQNGNYMLLDTQLEAVFQIAPGGAATLFVPTGDLSGGTSGVARNPLTNQYVVGYPNELKEVPAGGGSNINTLTASGQLASPAAVVTLTEDFPSTVDATNPLAYFRLETQSGVSEVNGAYSYNLTGGATIPPALGAPIGNPANNYASLDGSSGEVTTSLSGNVNTAGSMMAWVNLSELPSSAGQISYIAGESAQGNDFDLQIETDNSVHFYTTCCAASMSYTPSQATLMGQWHMVVATFDATASTRAIYWDGVLAASDSVTSQTNKTGAFWIGNTSLNASFGNRYFNGGIDEVAVWNYALTAPQVYRMFASRPPGAGGTVNSLSPTSAALNSSATTLTVSGQNLAPESNVWWTSPPAGQNPAGQTTILTPTSVTANQIVVTIPSGLLTTAGIAEVSVVNPAGVPANELPFTVPYPALSISPSTNSLPSGQTNQLYSQTLTASGGSGNYSWAITNQPNGLNLSLIPSTGTNVSLTGTPTTADTDPGFSITVTLTDTTTGAQLPQTYTIGVSQGQAGGSVITWALSATFADGGTLTGPFGIDLADGTIGNWNIVASAGSILAAFTYTPANSTANYSPEGSSGCPGPCVSFTSNQQFPNGLPPPENFNENRLLVLSFLAPLTENGGTVNLYLDNSNDTASHECLDCNPFRLFTQGSATAQTPPPYTPPPYTPPSLPVQGLSISSSTTSIATTTGGAVSASFSASGGAPPYSFTATGQPAGIAIGSGGSLGGSTSQAGTFSVAVTVTDANHNSASTGVAINVLGLTTTALPNGTAGQFYATTIGAAGGTGGNSFSASGLPSGLSMSSSGYLSGTVNSAGTYTLSVTVSSGGLNIAGSVSLTIAKAVALSISSASLPDGTVNTFYSQSLGAAGGVPPYTWAVTEGSPLQGFSMSTSGIVSGTPGVPGNVSFGVQVTDAAGATATATASILIHAAPLIITTQSLPSGMNGVDYPQQTIAASGGVAPYLWTVSSGSALPSGVTFSSGGVLSGVPGATGAFSIGVAVTDSASPKPSTTSATLGLTIRAPSADLILTSGSLGYSLSTPAMTPPASQTVGVQSTVSAQKIGYSVSVNPASPWLSVTSGTTTPDSIQISLTSAALNLGSGDYTATIVATCTSVSCMGHTQSVSLDLNVTTQPPDLQIDNGLLVFATTNQNLGPISQPIEVENTGGGTIGFASAVCEAAWCMAGPAPASVGGGSSASVPVTVDPSVLTPGFYRTQVDIATSAGKGSIPVTLFIANNSTMTLAPAGQQFSMPAGGAPGNPNGSFLVSVDNSTPVNWIAAVLPGASWLALGTPGGTSSSSTSLAPGTVSFSIDPAGAAALSPGAYYGRIEIASADVSNSPLDFEVVLNVTQANAPVTPDAEPGGLLFITTVGGMAPPETVTVYSSSTTPSTFQTSAATKDGNGWLSVSPGTGAAAAGSPGVTAVSVSTTGLNAGVYYGGVSYSLSATAVRTVNVTLIVTGATSATSAGSAASILSSFSSGDALPRAAGCTPTVLVPTQTGLVNSFSAPAGWPTPLAILLSNDCGSVVNNGQLVATFSNGDPPLALALANPSQGLYSGTWSPAKAASQVSITVRASAPGFPAVSSQLAGAVVPNAVPLLTPNGTLHSFDPLVGAALAPGTIVAIYGQDLAALTSQPTIIPLPTTVNGTSVIIGGMPAPLYYVSAAQINAQIPFELQPGQQYQVIVSANGALTTPDSIQLSAATPGLAAFSDGTLIAQHSDGSLVSATSPAQAGEYLVAYLAGMGGTTVPVASGAGSPGSPLAQPAETPVLTIDGNAYPILFAGLTPGLVGLYQMNFQAPAGLPAGDVTVVVSQNGQSSNQTFLPYQP